MQEQWCLLWPLLILCSETVHLFHVPSWECLTFSLDWSNPFSVLCRADWVDIKSSNAFYHGKCMTDTLCWVYLSLLASLVFQNLDNISVPSGFHGPSGFQGLRWKVKCYFDGPAFKRNSVFLSYSSRYPSSFCPFSHHMAWAVSFQLLLFWCPLCLSHLYKHLFP